MISPRLCYFTVGEVILRVCNSTLRLHLLYVHAGVKQTANYNTVLKLFWVFVTWPEKVHKKAVRSYHQISEQNFAFEGRCALPDRGLVFAWVSSYMFAHCLLLCMYVRACVYGSCQTGTRPYTRRCFQTYFFASTATFCVKACTECFFCECVCVNVSRRADVVYMFVENWSSVQESMCSIHFRLVVAARPFACLLVARIQRCFTYGHTPPQKWDTNADKNEQQTATSYHYNWSSDN